MRVLKADLYQRLYPLCGKLIKMALCLLPFATLNADEIELSACEEMEIGLKIWKNECGGKIEGLTTWNEGEEFASMGIGHFIWYPKGCSAPYDEQFYNLLSFFDMNGVALPAWLRDERACPWKSKVSFDRDLNGQKLKDLRLLLADTVGLQARFMVKRLQKALPKLEAAASPGMGEKVKERFHQIATSEGGSYLLIDYINFKGEGTSQSERYGGEGWGLLQVLEAMPEVSPYHPVANFIDTAKKLLRRRVENAPPERGEGRWLKGWCNRLESYRWKGTTVRD